MSKRKIPEESSSNSPSLQKSQKIDESIVSLDPTDITVVVIDAELKLDLDENNIIRYEPIDRCDVMVSKFCIYTYS